MNGKMKKTEDTVTTVTDKMKVLEGHTNLNNTLKSITDERDRFKEERERDTVIKQNLLDETAILTDKLIAAKEEIKEKVDDYNDLMKKHKKKKKIS